MSSHPTPEQLEQYVLGALDGAGGLELEAHLGACPACTAALAREARLELGLAEAARLPTPLLARRRRWVGVAAAGSGLAAAAAAALVLGWFEAAPRPDRAPMVLRCDQAHAPGECLARGQFDGVIAIGPGRQVVVPRYDGEGTP